MIKVLVCDDDRIITEKVQQLLTIVQEQYSFELDIKTYNDGRLAMESEEIYDIAIVDIEMPDVDGLALSENLKKRNSDAIVLILTSFSDYLDSAMRIHFPSRLTRNDLRKTLWKPSVTISKSANRF